MFQKLKVFIGAQREKALDNEKREAREAKEKEAREKKESLQAELDAVAKAVEETFGNVASAEKKAGELVAKARTEPASDLIKFADEVEETVTSAREAITSSKTDMEEIVKTADEALKSH